MKSSYLWLYSTRILLGERSSRVMMTLSDPLTTKYPPGSRGSSPNSIISSRDRPERLQTWDIIMMGSMPIIASTGSFSVSPWTIVISRRRGEA